jgi:UPF0716 family protein affecting phage T7 exclusion
MINFFQMLILVFAALIAALVGIHVSKHIGWWAMIPAYLLLSFVGFIACSTGVREIRASLKIFRKKLRDGQRK